MAAVARREVTMTCDLGTSHGGTADRNARQRPKRERRLIIDPAKFKTARRLIIPLNLVTMIPPIFKMLTVYAVFPRCMARFGMRLLMQGG